jgi:hypothetical protein
MRTTLLGSQLAHIAANKIVEKFILIPGHLARALLLSEIGSLNIKIMN